MWPRPQPSPSLRTGGKTDTTNQSYNARITEHLDDARDAFKDYVSSHCCYNEGPASDGVITKMEPYDTYRYRLETYTESRSTEWATKPHEGEPADFYTQTAPRPWEVPATAPNLFTNHTEEIRVPYTSSVKDCNSCHSTGTMPCDECHGDGSKVCWVCNGSGKRGEESCTQCDASGKERCDKCDSRGTKECETCKGKRQLLTYIQLKLYPLLGFPNPAISEASEKMVREHQSKYAQNARILQQRQTVELIPITKVKYKWKSDSHKYYVYGNERKVDCDKYPATCCCVIQ
ncbi:hypothetical protein F7725_017428 [Dissostichus mawsoni]|uniref:Protein SSUH2 homolog n=1 Tax=Dissostichus mawsoni TaxID=36200 RepID=A0A7J5Z4E3_DISMA|nr:hypothetical protein F7725_017428 [Dissostichus mawsoni]